MNWIDGCPLVLDAIGCSFSRAGKRHTEHYRNVIYSNSVTFTNEKQDNFVYKYIYMNWNLQNQLIPLMAKQLVLHLCFLLFLLPKSIQSKSDEDRKVLASIQSF